MELKFFGDSDKLGKSSITKTIKIGSVDVEAMLMLDEEVSENWVLQLDAFLNAIESIHEKNILSIKDYLINDIELDDVTEQEIEVSYINIFYDAIVWDYVCESLEEDYISIQTDFKGEILDIQIEE